LGNTKSKIPLLEWTIQDYLPDVKTEEQLKQAIRDYTENYGIFFKALCGCEKK
jgi:sRNA-binding protein